MVTGELPEGVSSQERAEEWDKPEVNFKAASEVVQKISDEELFGPTGILEFVTADLLEKDPAGRGLHTAQVVAIVERSLNKPQETYIPEDKLLLLVALFHDVDKDANTPEFLASHAYRSAMAVPVYLEGLPMSLSTEDKTLLGLYLARIIETHSDIPYIQETPRLLASLNGINPKTAEKAPRLIVTPEPSQRLPGPDDLETPEDQLLAKLLRAADTFSNYGLSFDLETHYPKSLNAMQELPEVRFAGFLKLVKLYANPVTAITEIRKTAVEAIETGIYDVDEGLKQQAIDSLAAMDFLVGWDSLKEGLAAYRFPS